jgi:GT2 family glycosyltransferase
MMSTANADALRIVVIVASTGRPASLAQLVSHLQIQTLPPREIVLSVVTPADLPPALPTVVPGVDGRPIPVTLARGTRGLPAQRNTGLRSVTEDADLIAFLDDDYIPAKSCLQGMSNLFQQYGDIAGATGHLLADGIHSAGVSQDEAEKLLATFEKEEAPNTTIVRELQGLYGCNMVFRRSLTEGIEFDERLKLYGWQEDIDFSNQVSRRGRLVKTLAFTGIHQGIKSGRTSGIRLGYSQVVNPAYLVKKGTMSAGYARKIVLRNIAANHLKMLRPEPWVDRWGRAKGNWIGLLDLLLGKLTPERIENL